MPSVHCAWLLEQSVLSRSVTLAWATVPPRMVDLVTVGAGGSMTIWFWSAAAGASWRSTRSPRRYQRCGFICGWGQSVEMA